MDEPVRLLCVDTSTFHESVALTNGADIIAETCIERRGGHGPGILDDIAELLESTGWTLSDLDGFACGLGPGGFTGLRIGLSTVKAFALALQCPVYGARTTELLKEAHSSEHTVAIVDARRQQVYLDADHLPQPICCDPQDLPRHLDRETPWVLIGDGALKYASEIAEMFPAALIPDDDARHRPRAGLLPRFIDLARPASTTTLEPVYIRKSDAEINFPDGFPDALKHQSRNRKKS
jgi:tRNA threonylcarbamoyladenosine biosynthesis protein TsaB